MQAVLKFIPKEYKKQFFGIAALNILRGILDLAGLAALLPIVIVLLDETLVVENDFLSALFALLPVDNLKEFKVALSICVLLWLPLKSMLTIWINKSKHSYLLQLYRYYASAIFRLYHQRGLLFIKQSHSSQLSVKINGACYGFAVQIVGGLINLSSEIFIVVLLGILALYASPVAVILLFIIVLPLLFVYFIFARKKVKELGAKSFEKKKEQAAIVQDSLRGYVSMTISGSQKRVFDKFNAGLNDISRSDINYGIYNQIPSLILQITVATALIALMFSNSYIAGSTSLFVVFGFIAAKMMPSLIRISNLWTILNGGVHFLETINELNTNEEVECEDSEQVPTISLGKAIRIENIFFTFADGVDILKNFSLNIKKGEIIGFKGESGVGKSTLFNLLLGLYQPNKGDIYIDDVALSRKNIAEWHKIIGYAEQETFICNDTLAYNIALTDNIDTKRVQQLIESVGLRECVEALPDGLNTKMNESGTNLSGGERQRIGVARALYKNVQVLLLDETTSALDARNEESIISLLHDVAKNNNITMLIISHRNTSLSLCDRVIEM